MLSLSASLSGANVAPQRLQRCRLRLQLRMQLLSTLQTRQQHLRILWLMQLLGIHIGKASTTPGMHVYHTTALLSKVTLGACVQAQKQDKHVVATFVVSSGLQSQ